MSLAIEYFGRLAGYEVGEKPHRRGRDFLKCTVTKW
jgi:hypothetical protein